MIDDAEKRDIQSLLILSAPRGWDSDAAQSQLAERGWMIHLQGTGAYDFTQAGRDMVATALGQAVSMSRMKDAAVEAHRICYETMKRHPEVAELGDDGELHQAIHAIVGVGTPDYVALPGLAGRIVDGLVEVAGSVGDDVASSHMMLAAACIRSLAARHPPEQTVPKTHAGVSCWGQVEEGMLVGLSFEHNERTGCVVKMVPAVGSDSSPTGLLRWVEAQAADPTANERFRELRDYLSSGMAPAAHETNQAENVLRLLIAGGFVEPGAGDHRRLRACARGRGRGGAGERG